MGWWWTGKYQQKKSYNIVVIKNWAKFPLQIDGWIDL